MNETQLELRTGGGVRWESLEGGCGMDGLR